MTEDVSDEARKKRIEELKRRANDLTGGAITTGGNSSLSDGDLVDAKEHRGKIILTPKNVVDREYTPAQRRSIDARLDEAMREVERGELYGPFETHQELVSFLHRESRKRQPNNTKPPKRQIQ